MKRRISANVAQLVEQLTRNEQVSGSSPLVGSILIIEEIFRLNPIVIIPTYVSRSNPSRSQTQVIANYDHTSDINSCSELNRCLKSLQCVKDLGVVMVLVAAENGLEKEAVEKVKQICANNPAITTMVVGQEEVNLLKSRLEQVGCKDIVKHYILRGYGNIKNIGITLANAFGFDAVIFIDDDEIIEDSYFLHKAVYGLGKLTPSGVPILAKTGYYINKSNTYLSSWEDAWYNKFWQQGSAFNNWISKAMMGPRLSRSNHVCGGCMAIHKEAFSRISFDPYIARGEDLDYMVNLRMHGSDIWFDKEWSLRRIANNTKGEGRRFRIDIYRWLYEQAKIEFSWSLIDLQKITAAQLMPYPGSMLGKGLKTRIWITALLRSLGKSDKSGYREAARSARKDALNYAERNCTRYFDFQRLWPEMMTKIEGDRVISAQILKTATDLPASDLNPGLTTEIQMNIG